MTQTPFESTEGLLPEQQAQLEEIYHHMINSNKRRNRQEGSSTEDELSEPAKLQKIDQKMDMEQSSCSSDVPSLKPPPALG